MLFQVYCQKCNKDLTALGGDVFPSGRIYCPQVHKRPQWGCQDYEPSILIQEGKNPEEKDMQPRYISPNKILLSVITFKLTRFKKLEDKLTK